MTEKHGTLRVFYFLAAALLAGSWGHAELLYDQDVTFGDLSTGPSDPVRMLYGSGTNGGFTVDRRNGVEIGLRGILRFGTNNQPQNIYNSNGDGTYSFPTGTPDLSKPHPEWATTTTPVWSISFSINTDYDDRDDTPAKTLKDYTYEVGMDFDPVGQNNWLRVDPISYNSLFTQALLPDHAFGLYNQQSPGLQATSLDNYLVLLESSNIVHNSQNYEFFNFDLSAFGMGDYSDFDPNQPGIYTIYLAAYSGMVEVARSEIEIHVGMLVETPSLLGLTLSQAEDALTAAGLVLGTVTEEYSSLAAGTVISQNPNEQSLPPGQAVNLVVSKGEAPPVPAAGAPGLLLLAVALAALIRPATAGCRRR